MIIELIAVKFLYFLIVLLKLEGQSVVIDKIALRKDVVLSGLLVFHYFHDGIFMALALKPQRLRNAHVLVGLDDLAAYLKRNGRVVVD